MKNHVSILIILLATAASCKKEIILTPAAKTNNPQLSVMDKAVQQAYLKYQNNLNTAGVSIGILRNDTTFFYGYGETKTGTGIVPEKNTYFEIGSLTKTFTAIAIMNMLAEKNQTIENTVRNYLPANLPTLQRDGVEVTFKHLLTHTSGLPYFPDNFGVGLYTGKIASEFANYDRNKLYTHLKNVHLIAKPFTKWEYSNTGMGLLGTILGLNYNTQYGDILQDKIFTPLQLTDTKTDMADTDASRWATGYNKGRETPYWNSLNALDGAGVIKSTAADLIKYGQANLNPPNSQLGASITSTHQITYLPFEDRDVFKINGRLGWFQLIHKDLPAESFIWHNGGTGGFSTDMFINKSRKSILVLLYNSDKGTQEREDFKLELLKLICQ
ncbi:serine hydrolase domain-containing protein [Ferruginibacter sp.]